MRTCVGCGTDITCRSPTASFCGESGCYSAHRADVRARHAAQRLALLLVKHRMKPTVIRSPLHGWCVRATMPHGPEVYFIDEDDLSFYLAERPRAAA